MEPSSRPSTEINGVTGGACMVAIQPQQMFQKSVSETDSLSHSPANLESKEVNETKALAAELCRHFYTLGWVSGTGGCISIKVHDDSVPKPQQLLIMSPSGVQKERMVPDDLYVLSSDGFILSSPPHKKYPHKHHKCTDCAPIFMKVYEMCGAGAVIHSHGMEACLATMIVPSSKEFRISHMEMIKGIQGLGYHDELVLPIIENTAFERDLTQDFSQAIRAYPKATAILVRNHGVFIWGDSWISAKTQAECFHYLFDAAIKLNQLGLDWSTPNHGPIRVNGVWGCGMNFSRSSKTGGSFNSYCMIEPSQSCILLNLEGTTTPQSYFTNATNVIEETLDDINLPCYQGSSIWRTGFVSNEFVGFLFDDVPEALMRWQASGIKVYIYSRGSRVVQQVLFANSNYGDLRKCFCGYFDKSVGDKTETQSYNEILRTVGVDRPSDMLFVTDVFEEAIAARTSGLEVIISIRPGNGPLPENHGFRTIHSLLEIYI